MPNVNPRLQVILPRHVDATIAKLARLQRRSKSAVARDFLTEVEPVLARVAATLEAAAALDAKGRAKFIGALERTQAAVEASASHAVDDMNRTFALATPAETGRRRRPSGPASRRRPPN